MRVNVEDDLWTSGRLTKLARTMGWNERESIGALVCVYRATQNAEVITASVDRLVTLCAVYFDSDEDAEKFIRAMLSARLASFVDDTLVFIKGNEPHVDRVRTLRANASKGGKSTQSKKRNDSQTDSLAAAKLQLSYSQATRSPPSSLLLNTNSEFHSNGGADTISEDVAKPEPALTPKRFDQSMLGLLYGTYRANLKAIRGVDLPLSPMKETLWAIADIANSCKADTAAVLDAFVRDPNPFYDKTQWPLSALKKDLNVIYSRVKKGTNTNKAREKALVEHERAKAALEAMP